MPPKALTALAIEPGTAEQIRPGTFGSSSARCPPYQSVDLPARPRTRHACDRCRRFRTKCSGGERCGKCTKDEAACIYSDRKRERHKMDTARSAQQIEDLQNDKRELQAALKLLTEDLGTQAGGRLDDIRPVESNSTLKIEKPSPGSQSSDPSQDPSQGRSRYSLSPRPVGEVSIKVTGTSAATADSGEGVVGSHVRSRDRHRELSSAVTLRQGKGMPGHVGKMADAAWIHSVRTHVTDNHLLSQDNVLTANAKLRTIRNDNMSYFTDDQDLLTVEEDSINPFQLPPWHMAKMLSEAYFRSLHGAFRFVGYEKYLQDLENVYEKPSVVIATLWHHRSFLALSNVMWAVGAKWLELADLEQQHPSLNGRRVSEGHLTYYARARALGLDHRMQLDHPCIELLQGMSVLALYLMLNGSINKSSALIAQIVRHAASLGIHLEVAQGVLPNSEMKSRSELWWSIFRLEVLLSEITGRPKCLRGDEVTAPFHSLLADLENGAADVEPASDIPHMEKDSSMLWSTFIGYLTDANIHPFGEQGLWDYLVTTRFTMSHTHFVAAVGLSSISDRISSSLYLSPTDLTWSDVQTTVRDLEAELVHWEEILGKTSSSPIVRKIDIDQRASLELEMYICSLRMILYRPFLSEFKIEKESAQSIAFNTSSAVNAVTAAIRMMDLMPKRPESSQVLLVLPWWTVLHYICQVGGILLIEMCLSLQHAQNYAEGITMAMTKVFEYLWVLTPGSKSAYRAWNILRPLLGKTTPSSWQSMLSGIPLEAKMPRDWSEDDEYDLQQLLH